MAIVPANNSAALLEEVNGLLDNQNIKEGTLTPALFNSEVETYIKQNIEKFFTRGTATVTFPGASNASENLEISHSLAIEPYVFLICRGVTSGVGAFGGNFAEIISKTSTKVTIRALNPFAKPNAAETLKVEYIFSK